MLNQDFLNEKIILGCMRIFNLDFVEADDLIKTALENNINFFDHADIYGKGKSEELFGQVLKNINRDDIILQSKCSIKSGMYDFSKEHIINSVENSLKRLNTDYLDILLLHRPDTLVEPEEVAEAFYILEKEKKVLNFGVSNHNSMQIEFLQKYIKQKLLFNQLQFGIMHTGIIDFGINTNMKNEASINHDGSFLEYSRLNDIKIQAWSPFLHGSFREVFLDNDKFPEVNKVLKEISNKYSVSTTTISAAWILRHPANIQVISGTTKSSRIIEVAKATEIYLTREEWYKIYLAAGNSLP